MLKLVCLNGGRVIYQRKKNVSNEIRPLVFASVPQSFFLVAASKTDVASKTEYNNLTLCVALSLGYNTQETDWIMKEI